MTSDSNHMRASDKDVDDCKVFVAVRAEGGGGGRKKVGVGKMGVTNTETGDDSIKFTKVTVQGHLGDSMRFNREKLIVSFVLPVGLPHG